jgi:hypothetical protein
MAFLGKPLPSIYYPGFGGFLLDGGVGREKHKGKIK